MTETPAQVVGFDSFEIDLARGELRNNGAIVPVEPQVLDLIAFLASQPGRVLSRDEIIEAVWNGHIVSDSAISTRINAARHVLGDDGTAQRVIRTVPRRVFLFVPEVAKVDVETSVMADPNAVGLALRDHPSVVVMPFENMSGDPEQQYFSDGLSDDIITELARYDELVVIARNAAFSYRERSRDVQTVARELGVQYVLEGGVRRAGKRIRVTAQLIDGSNGSHLWAERYDRDLDDIFAVQDEITGVIVNTLIGKLTHQHNQRALARRPDAMDAYDHSLRAMELFWKITLPDNLKCRSEAQQAIAIEPGFARAQALLAWTHCADGSQRWGDDPAESFRLAYIEALKAVALDDQDPWAHSGLGFAELTGLHEHERGLASYERAIALNPSSAHFRLFYALGLAYSGRAEEGLREVETAIRLNPHCPPVYLNILSRILYSLTRYDDALLQLERVVVALPDSAHGFVLQAACFGKLPEAKAAMETVLALNPRTFHLKGLREMVPYAEKAKLAAYVDELRIAGMPEMPAD